MHPTAARTVLSLSLVLASAAGAQPLNFVAEFDGMVNAQPIRATGSGTMDRNGFDDNRGRIEFSDIPDGFDPFAVDVMLTNVCPNGFRAENGTSNLWDLAGGSYGVERTFQWIGLPDSFVTADAIVTFDDDTQTVTSQMTFAGNYNGPTDLVAIESYSVLWLPGSTDGEVFEAGAAVTRRANGEQLIVQFATRYYGLDQNLANPQSGLANFDATFDGQTLEIGWDGYFQVAPAPGTASLLLLAPLAARRRR